jgi:hypothetical protein
MYAPLLITIIFAILFIPSLLWLILPYRLYQKYDKKCYYTDANDERCFFYPDGIQEKRMIEAGREEEVKRLRKYANKRQFWSKQWCDNESLRGTIFTIICIVLVIFSLITFIVPLEPRDEAMYWEEFAPMAQNIIDNADTAQSVAIAGDIIEYNKWLANARASQRAYGCWSSYYFIDLSNLNYITVN